VILILWAVWNTDTLVVFAKQHTILAPFLIILWRILGVVIPPIPGGLVSIALIPVFGWFLSFIYMMIGLLTGCSIAFWLGRKYGKNLVKKFIPISKIDDWESKFNLHTKFFAFLVIRFTTGPVLDFVSYIAGLTKISFRMFFLATLIALIPDGVYYYFGETVYQSTPPWVLTVIILGLMGFYFAKKYQFVHKFKRLKTKD